MDVTNSLQAINIPTYHYVAIDIHCTNAVVCVNKVHAVDKQGVLVEKTIYCYNVSIHDGAETFEKCMQRYCEGVSHSEIVESTCDWYTLADIFEQLG